MHLSGSCRGEKPLTPEDALVEKCRDQLKAASKEYLGHLLDGGKAHIIRSRMVERLQERDSLPVSFQPNQVELSPTLDDEVRKEWAELDAHVWKRRTELVIEANFRLAQRHLHDVERLLNQSDRFLRETILPDSRKSQLAQEWGALKEDAEKRATEILQVTKARLERGKDDVSVPQDEPNPFAPNPREKVREIWHSAAK